MIYDLFAKSADVIGIIGVIILLIAYYLLSTGKMSAHSMRYQVYNCVGALLILYSLCFHWNTASVLIEIAWVFISVIGMIRVLRAKPKSHQLYVVNGKEKNLCDQNK